MGARSLRRSATPLTSSRYNAAGDRERGYQYDAKGSAEELQGRIDRRRPVQLRLLRHRPRHRDELRDAGAAYHARLSQLHLRRRGQTAPTAAPQPTTATTAPSRNSLSQLTQVATNGQVTPPSPTVRRLRPAREAQRTRSHAQPGCSHYYTSTTATYVVHESDAASPSSAPVVEYTYYPGVDNPHGVRLDGESSHHYPAHVQPHVVRRQQPPRRSRGRSGAAPRRGRSRARFHDHPVGQPVCPEALELPAREPAVLCDGVPPRSRPAIRKTFLAAHGAPSVQGMDWHPYQGVATTSPGRSPSHHSSS